MPFRPENGTRTIVWFAVELSLGEIWTGRAPEPSGHARGNEGHVTWGESQAVKSKPWAERKGWLMTPIEAITVALAFVQAVFAVLAYAAQKRS